MKNQFIAAFNESLDKESNAGIMHLKDVQAKKAGKSTFELGGEEFPVKEKGKVLDKEGAGVLHFKDQKAKEAGKSTFELGGEEFPVKENDPKWIQHAHVKKGGLHKALHVPQGEKIPTAKLNKAVHSKSPHTRHMAQFAKNVHESLGGGFMEAKPTPAPAAAPAAEPTPAVSNGDPEGWAKSLDPKTDPSKFDGAKNPALKLDTEGVAKAREWVKKLDDMATFINGTDEASLNAQINALEMRNSIPFKGIVRREEKRITKLAENLRGLAELFKTVITSSGKKIHDATSRITSR